MNKKRILVVDDNVHATQIVKVALEQTNRYVVRTLNDPARSLATAREFQPDLILLDVCMPGLGGDEVAETIAQAPELAATPIVFLTCIVTPREAGRAGTLVIGRHEYIPKPARVETIIACVDKHLARALAPA